MSTQEVYSLAMRTFQRIGVTCKPIDQPLTRSLIERLLTYLDHRGLDWLLDETLGHIGFSDDEIVARDELVAQSDLIVVVGGDGTLLDAARSIAGRDIALIGVNIGRLGFLVDVCPDEIETQLNSIFAGRYHEERRAMLQGEIRRGDTVIQSGIALNDVVLHNRARVRMIEFETRIDQQRVNTHRADGIVVCTPTGSTAYALSGGGPILHPELSALALVPICPHTLSNRPIVVTGDRRISIRLCHGSHTSAMAAFDAQNTVDIEPGDEVHIWRHPTALRLLHPPGYDYYEILRKKLRWSEHP
ncbi:MAG TPA: NAD(+) kinase [Gammaproteobacteria bacterium]|nr:NAD(+) kinase [Gammaproteobacteria bacterium]